MESKYLENVEFVRERRINFIFNGYEYCVNITNHQELRIACVDGAIVIKPCASNSIIIETE